MTIGKHNFKMLTFWIILRILIISTTWHRPYSHTLIEVKDVKITLQDVPDTDGHLKWHAISSASISISQR